MALNNQHFIYSIKANDLDQKIDKTQYERAKKLDKLSSEQFARAVIIMIFNL